MIRLELSVDTLPGALAAAAAGADRIELCTAALDGGLTPSHGVIAEVVARCPVPVHVLVRPRGGDFLYTPGELDAMVADIADAVALGAAGVVSGALTQDGSVDETATGRLIAAAGDREFTFHRAIDVSVDPFAALDVLCGLGVHRVLTSGAAPTAMVGRNVLTGLVRRARPGTSVMACGGVRSDSIMDIVLATGVQDVHAAPRRPERGRQRPSASAVDFTSGSPPDGYDRFELDEQVAAELRAIVDAYPR